MVLPTATQRSPRWRRVSGEGTSVRVLAAVHATASLIPDPAFVIAAIHVEHTKEQSRHAPKVVAAARRRIRRRSPEVSVSTRIREGIPKDLLSRGKASDDIRCRIQIQSFKGAFRYREHRTARGSDHASCRRANELPADGSSRRDTHHDEVGLDL